MPSETPLGRVTFSSCVVAPYKPCPALSQVHTVCFESSIYRAMAYVVKWRAVTAVVLCFAALSSRVESATNYCDICSDHTLCKYKGDGAACTRVLGSGVNSSNIAIILDQHNKYRNTVASGAEQRGNPGPQPSATNMKKLTWDSELAAIAQRWADQCTFGHDSCRNVPRFYVGQNVYASWTTASSSGPNWRAAIQAWYDEVEAFDSRTVGSFVFRYETGHYTQVVWADTQYVGCGLKVYRDLSGRTVALHVCDYGPGGNYIGQPVYKVGAACSACGGGCDSTYRALCA